MTLFIFKVVASKEYRITKNRIFVLLRSYFIYYLNKNLKDIFLGNYRRFLISSPVFLVPTLISSECASTWIVPGVHRSPPALPEIYYRTP